MGESARESVVVSFHGVRGSTPCSCPTLQRYGGNTSCVSIETEGQAPIVFDLGTGLRQWGHLLADTASLTIHALVTHLHWDHVQGLPFFLPLHRDDTTLNVYGPGEDDESMATAFSRFMAPPFFPIRADDLASTINFHDVADHDFLIDDAEVMVRPVPHTGYTNGYRVTRSGVSVAYVPDHQEPIGRPEEVDDAVLELCEDVDVLIHDAQFRADEIHSKADWGHCTVDYALEVAMQAGARSLVLFHHDPGHDDDELDRMTEEVVGRGLSGGLESVVAAAEGMKLAVTPRI